MKILSNDDYISRRSCVLSKQGMVASSQNLASMAGIEILSKGGNAADAAIATAAGLQVTQPCSTGLGGGYGYSLQNRGHGFVLESPLSGEVSEELSKRGHNIGIVSGKDRHTFGLGQIIMVKGSNDKSDSTSVYWGASDPRGDCCAIGR